MDRRSAHPLPFSTGLLSLSIRRPAAALLLSVIGWVAIAGSVAPAQPPPRAVSRVGSDAGKLAGQYVDAFLERERLRAGSALLGRQSREPDQSDPPQSPSFSPLASLAASDAEALAPLARVADRNSQALVRQTEQLARELDAQVHEAAEEWKAVRTSLNQRRFLLFEVKAGRRVAGQLASLLSVDKRWFWLFGVIAVSTLAAVAFHDRRHELRRLLNGGRARAMRLSKFLTAAIVVLVMLTLATLFMSDRIYESLLAVGLPESPGPLGVIESENAALADEVASLRREREALGPAHDRAIAALAESWAAAFGRNRPARAVELHKAALAASEATAALEALPQAMQVDAAQLAELDRELEAQTEALAGYLRLRQWIRGGLGLALLGLALAGGLLYRRGVRQRQQVTAGTCPLCLGVGHLESMPDDAQRGNGRGKVDVVQCKSILSEDPYEECDYAFMDVYRRMSKICFPTLGVPQAGKTHWLSMLYWELNRGNYPRSVQFEKVRSQSSEDFDVVVEEILRSRIGTAATQRDRIPRPLVFNFQDRDAWGRSNVLVNIFDYSGEVTADMGLEDYRRRRALEADGFFFFLDPTYPSEPQAKALVDFREDIRLVKGVSAGKAIRTPVAICVSKIDVLAAQSYALPDGGDAIARFYEQLSQIDPTGEAMTLPVIEARSRLTAELRDTIWPGWQIERQIDDLFGGRYRFFPLTPVGLDGKGEADLSLRTISPFGLLEPLLWLLEMNGYPVLE